MPTDTSNPFFASLSRRQVLEGALLLGGAAMLTGCQTGGRGVANLPPDVWPDPHPTTVPPVASTPAPGPGRTVTTGLPEGVIPRSVWTSSRPNMRLSKPMNGVERITVHHSADNSMGLLAKADVMRKLEGIRQSHISRFDDSTAAHAHWIDIGYHYIIDPAGRIWEGRPTTIEGAHVSQTNPHNLGVMVMGNFNQHRPTTAALNTLDSFVASQMRRYRVPMHSVYTHQELKPTECPGTFLQQYMLTTRLAGGRMSRTAMA